MLDFFPINFLKVGIFFFLIEEMIFQDINLNMQSYMFLVSSVLHCVALLWLLLWGITKFSAELQLAVSPSCWVTPYPPVDHTI